MRHKLISTTIIASLVAISHGFQPASIAGSTAQCSSASTKDSNDKPSQKKPMLSQTADPNPAVLPGVDTLPLKLSEQAKALAASGQRAAATGDFAAAEVEFRLSLNLDSTNTDALVGLAQTLEQEGKGREAITVYRTLVYPKQGWGTSLEQDPILRMHLAALLAENGVWGEAVSVYESTIGAVSLGSAYPAPNTHFSSLTPQPALLETMAHLAIGIVHSNRLEHTQALAEYKVAQNMQPDLAVTNYYYGLGLERLGQISAAKDAYSTAQKSGDDEFGMAATTELKRLP